METIKETVTLIFGDKAISYYLACFFFSTIGIAIMLRVAATKRDKESTRTPERFSWLFLAWDNIKKVVTTYLLLFTGYRFLPEMSLLWALGMGFAASLGIVYLFNVLSENIPGFKKFIQQAKEKP